MPAGELFPPAAKEGMTFVPGSYFFPCARAQTFMRLNFAMHAPDVIEEGMCRLGRAMGRYREQQESGGPAPGQQERNAIVLPPV